MAKSVWSFWDHDRLKSECRYNDNTSIHHIGVNQHMASPMSKTNSQRMRCQSSGYKMLPQCHNTHTYINASYCNTVSGLDITASMPSNTTSAYPPASTASVATTSSRRPKYRSSDLKKALEERTTEIRRENSDRSDNTVECFISEDAEIKFLTRQLQTTKVEEAKTATSSTRAPPPDHRRPPTCRPGDEGDNETLHSLAHMDHPRQTSMQQESDRGRGESSRRLLPGLDHGRPTIRHDDSRRTARDPAPYAQSYHPPPPSHTTSPAPPVTHLRRDKQVAKHKKSDSRSGDKDRKDRALVRQGDRERRDESSGEDSRTSKALVQRPEDEAKQVVRKERLDTTSKDIAEGSSGSKKTTTTTTKTIRRKGPDDDEETVETYTISETTITTTTTEETSTQQSTNDNSGSGMVEPMETTLSLCRRHYLCQRSTIHFMTMDHLDHYIRIGEGDVADQVAGITS